MKFLVLVAIVAAFFIASIAIGVGVHMTTNYN